jgi:hypothetical protein
MDIVFAIISMERSMPDLEFEGMEGKMQLLLDGFSNPLTRSKLIRCS